ncbi:Hypothetical predicted protein [Cloeon dipterum]|uniref:Transcription initiation factor IIF subunit alpha n=1 Tax=Cloeon dipterum TaxID=197152 RepID=A0A8S1CGX2_9INSE|nr:Hypothetical predicted protein [Cloeon dipterum]
MSTSQSNVNEYVIRCPKNTSKKFQVMRFASERDLDFKKWSNVKMERENNLREFKGVADEEQPKFGAGSEFGRDQREEARRKKLGIVSKKYRPDDQPWLLKVGGKTGKKFKGIRDGGINQNAAYYIFFHAPGGHIEAYPLQEWYNFVATQRFKALTCEEADEYFNKRNQQIDFYNVMYRKRCRGETEEKDAEALKEEKKKGKSKREFSISEMDEWMDSSDDDDDDGSGEEDKKEEKASKKKTKKGVDKNKKKKKKGSDDEATEESDDGDEEGREHEYISDSSSSESEHEETKQLRGVAEEDALRKLLNSDDESDEEQKEEEKKDEEVKQEEDEEKASKLTKKSKKKPDKKESKESSTDLSSNSDEEDKKPPEDIKPALQQPEKRKAATDTPPSSPPHKKARSEGVSDSMEEAVRRYLSRKPMTTTELIQKFNRKKNGISGDQLLKQMTNILKRINPSKQTIKGKMYLSIKN